MIKHKVIILGGGASACMCALFSKEEDIAIIDSAQKLAKKVLVTGNGKCNLTNVKLSTDAYNTNIDKYLSKFGVKDTLRFFESIGLEWYSDDEGRVYPFSNSAKSVQDIIINRLKNKVSFYSEEIVERIERDDKRYYVFTNKNEYECEKLVVALGGNSESVLNDLRVNYKKFIPSLVALKTEKTKELSGLRLTDVKVTAQNHNKKQNTMVGEVLFKDSGLSGIVIFNLSSIFARDGVFKGKVYIDLMKDFSIGEIIEKINKRKQIYNDTRNLFVGMFQNPVSNEVFKQAKIDINSKTATLLPRDITRIAEKIKNLEFNVLDAYDNNQIFAGGVPLHDLTDGLEHKQLKNLYFIGEICDVDGECGGYNLQWAWTSGRIVGEQL